MKKATYTRLDGTKYEVEYDENIPCIYCELPVLEASMGGTIVCPSCDCGYDRDGTKWDVRKYNEMMKNARKNIKKRFEDKTKNRPKLTEKGEI